MKDRKEYKQILPGGERYCIPGLNEIKVISDNQTLSLALGSCISTIMIGRNHEYVLGANHIVMANPLPNATIATKSAAEQVREIVALFTDVLEVERYFCFHLVGAGSKFNDASFDVHEKNIVRTMEVLGTEGIDILFNDTGSHYFCSYSLRERNLSVFIENNSTGSHKSFIIDLDRLWEMKVGGFEHFPTPMLDSRDPGFELLVEKMVIGTITGKRLKYRH